MIELLIGDDAFALRQALRSKVDGFKKQHGTLAIERLDGEEVSSEHIFDAVVSSSLLSPEKMVVLNSAGAHKELLERLADNPEVVPESTQLLLVEPKADKRAKYYKALKKAGLATEYAQSQHDDIATWTIEQAKSNDATISRADAQYLAQRVGSNKMLLANEIAKLASFDPTITREAIDQLSEPLPQSTVFQLLDSAFAGHSDRALSLYEDQRQQRVEPLAILAMIAWQLNIMAVVKTAGDRSPSDIAKQAKLSPFVVQKTMGIVKKLSLKQVRVLVRRALELDVKLKSTAVDADEALRYFLLNLSRV